MEASALRQASRKGLLPRRSPLLRLQGDERLVALVREGNAGAFETIVDRYQGKLHGFCRQMLKSNEDAEDVLQEVFVNAYRAMVADSREINLRPWLYRIARNRCLNHLRKPTADARESMDMVPMTDQASTAETVHNREEFRQLLDDVGKLPETQRSALLLREMDALTYEEIAESMDTTVPSVKSLLVRARMSLSEASEARMLSCGEVRVSLAEAAEGLAKISSPVRRHVRECEECEGFRKQLRNDSKAFATLFPTGPILALKALLVTKLGEVGAAGGGGAAGSSAGVCGGGAAAGAGGSAVAGAGAAAGGAAAAGAGAAAIGASGSAMGSALGAKAVAGVVTAAVITAGAVEVRSHDEPEPVSGPSEAAVVHEAKPPPSPPPPDPDPGRASAYSSAAGPAAAGTELTGDESGEPAAPGEGAGEDEDADAKASSTGERDAKETSEAGDGKREGKRPDEDEGEGESSTGSVAVGTGTGEQHIDPDTLVIGGTATHDSEEEGGEPGDGEDGESAEGESGDGESGSEDSGSGDSGSEQPDDGESSDGETGNDEPGSGDSGAEDGSDEGSTGSESGDDESSTGSESGESGTGDGSAGGESSGGDSGGEAPGGDETGNEGSGDTGESANESSEGSSSGDSGGSEEPESTGTGAGTEEPATEEA